MLRSIEPQTADDDVRRSAGEAYQDAKMSRHLKSMVRELENLQTDLSQYSDDYNKPTEYAQDTAAAVLRGSFDRGWLYPLGDLYADGDGGIRVEWQNKGKEVTLAIHAGPTDQHYIYHQSPSGHHEADYIVNSSNLARYLIWLINDGEE